MTRLGQAYVALILTLSGGLTGAAIALRWASDRFEHTVGPQ